MAEVTSQGGECDPTRMRADLAAAEAELRKLEEDMEDKVAQLGYLHTEYTANVSRLDRHYEPRVLPHLAITYAVEVKREYILALIDWIERKTTEQEKRSQTGVFMEGRDMLPAATELMKKARQKLLSSYEAINECPAETLQMVSNYQSPPDEAIETLQLAMRLRSEEDCSWRAARVVVSYNYFTGFFVTRSEGMLNSTDLLEPALMEDLEAFCENPAHSVESLYTSSTPIGCLGQWLHAVRDYYRVKLITAPVLLRDTSAAQTKRALALQHRLAFGAQREEDGEEDHSPSDGAANDDAVVASARTEEAAAVGEAEEGYSGTVLVNDKDVERDLLRQYALTKRNLQQVTQAGSVGQQMIIDLRHRLHRLAADSADALKAVSTLEAEKAEKLREIHGDYDSAMMPLHERLEGTTEDFVRVLTHRS